MVSTIRYFRLEQNVSPLPHTLLCFLSLSSHFPGPPSAPRNVISSINETSVILDWSWPEDSGGRRDITFTVVCKRCRGVAGTGSGGNQRCEPCRSNVRFLPRAAGLQNTTVTVADLLAHTNYTFEIEAQNGVSPLAPKMRQYAAVTITTNQAGEMPQQTDLSVDQSMGSDNQAGTYINKGKPHVIIKDLFSFQTHAVAVILCRRVLPLMSLLFQLQVLGITARVSNQTYFGVKIYLDIYFGITITYQAEIAAASAPVFVNFLAFGLDVPRQSSSLGSLCHKESKYTSRKSMFSKHMHSNHQPGHLQDNLSLLFCRLTIGSNVSILYRKKNKPLKDIEGEEGLLKFLGL